MIKRILLHVRAFLALLPMVAVFSEGSLWINTAGLVYFVCLGIWLNDSPVGQKFLRDYYREMLRIERMMNE